MIEVAAVGRGRQLALAAGAGDRHRLGAVEQVESLRRGEFEAEHRVDELAALDHALLRIVAVQQAVDPG